MTDQDVREALRALLAVSTRGELSAEVQNARAALAASDSTPAPIQGERFVRAWLQLDRLPGGMMESNHGRYGPIGALTMCAVTTSETFKDEWSATGKPFIEVWLAERAAVPASVAPPPVWMPLMDTNLAVRIDTLDETQAHKNHSQSLQRLAARGGLSPCEALALLLRREYRRHDAVAAIKALAALAAPVSCHPTDPLR